MCSARDCENDVERALRKPATMSSGTGPWFGCSLFCRSSARATVRMRSCRGARRPSSPRRSRCRCSGRGTVRSGSGTAAAGKVFRSVRPASCPHSHPTRAVFEAVRHHARRAPSALAVSLKVQKNVALAASLLRPRGPRACDDDACACSAASGCEDGEALTCCSPRVPRSRSRSARWVGTHARHPQRSLAPRSAQPTRRP